MEQESVSLNYSAPFGVALGSAWQRELPEQANEDDPKNGIIATEQSDAIADLEIPPVEIPEQKRPSIGIPAHIRYAVLKAQEENPLQSYNAEKEAFARALSPFPPEFQIELTEALEAFRFIDYADTAWELMEAFRSFGEIDILDYKLQTKYNSGRLKLGPSFANVQECNQFLKSTELPASGERLLAVQAIAMKGRVDGIGKQHLGKYRDHAVLGHEDEVGISRTELARIERNVYLSFEESSREEVDGNLRIFGGIVYPDPESVSERALDRIRDRNCELVSAIESYKALEGEEKDRVPESDLAELTQQLISEFVDERYDHFNAVIEEIGDFDTYKDVDRYVKAVAQHYRDIISIHPLADGNGRSCRLEALYAPLDRVGISRPRLNNTDADLLYSPSGWAQEVWRGVLSTSRTYLEVAERLEQGLRIENSPELIFPNLSRDVGVHVKAKKSVKQENGKYIKEWQVKRKNARLIPVDGAQFAAYVDARFALDEDQLYQQNFRNDPVGTMAILREDFKQHAKRSQSLVCEAGEEHYAVKLVDFDFMWTFGDQSAGDKLAWDRKMTRGYTNVIDYRGLSSFKGDGQLSEEEIANVFTVITDYTLCENLLGSEDLPEDHNERLSWIIDEFDRYNKSVLDGDDLVARIRDHVFAEGTYDTSFGQSRTIRWETARGFAMGGLTLETEPGDVQMQSYWKKQDQLDDRIVVGSYRATKDIEVNKLRLFEDKFRAKSHRQQEIMAIGGVDPDAVMIVQRIDPKGKIKECWVRDPAEPDSILHIDGPFMPNVDSLNEIDPVRIKKRFRLQFLDEQV